MTFAWLRQDRSTDLDATDSKLTDEDQDRVNMSWFTDTVHGSNSEKDNKQIVSKLWEQITGEDLISRLSTSKQRHGIRIWGRLAHRCDISYPSYNDLKPIHLLNGKEAIMKELRYAMRHAVASYPPAFILLLGLQSDASCAFKSTKKLLKSAFNIGPKHIIIDRCTANKTHQPAFYLCVDHHVSKIIISIRGTYSIADALTDANAIAKPYSAYDIHGYVHEGIIAAARFVVDAVTTQLIKTCNQFKEYQVIITGHSLGAGVAALAGFMYNDHPIIHQQNHLKVYAFASPPIVSKEFIHTTIGNDYITSIALSTDLVTRLSVESVKLMNLRLEIIMNSDRNTIRNCMTNLKDPDEQKHAHLDMNASETLKCLCIRSEYIAHKKRYMYVIQLSNGHNTWTITKRYNEFNRLNTLLQKKVTKCLDIELPYFPQKTAAFTVEQKKEIAQQRVHHFETYIQYIISDSQCLSLPAVRDFLNIPVSMNRSWQLIKILKETATPNPKEELFPLGQILWLVPKAVMKSDDIERRKTLMCLKNDEYNACENEIKQNQNDGDITTEARKRYKTSKTNSFSDVLATGWHNMTVGFEEFQETLDNITIGGGGEKKSKRFDGSNYILCDATECKEIFHQLVVDLPDSLRSHMANRYLWGLDARLTRGN